jgi:hypothetical protein
MGIIGLVGVENCSVTFGELRLSVTDVVFSCSFSSSSGKLTISTSSPGEFVLGSLTKHSVVDAGS